MAGDGNGMNMGDFEGYASGDEKFRGESLKQWRDVKNPSLEEAFNLTQYQRSDQIIPALVHESLRDTKKFDWTVSL